LSDSSGAGRDVLLARAGDVIRNNPPAPSGNRSFQSSAVLPSIKARYRTTKAQRAHPRPPQ
jgi:hypothetical protein